MSMGEINHINRSTKIVATIGPASSDPAILEELIRSGVNVVRFNFSHGSVEFHGENARNVRAASERIGRQVAILADLQGPKIRVSQIAGGAVQLSKGQALILDAAYEGEGNAERVGLDYRDLPKDVKAGDVLLLDDGLLRLTVTKVVGEEVHTVVENNAVLKSRKGINKVGGGLSAPALTDKDREDLKAALQIGADYIAVSFVKSAADMNVARELVAQASDGKHYPGLVAKIERVEAIENLEEIILASDGIMVARGDLAVEVGNAVVPALQKRMIKMARYLRRFVITATQMMESMIENPVPTRAEVSDVANAVLDGTDAVMLSAESAAGKYPVETVQMMAQVCQMAENAQHIEDLDTKLTTTDKIDHTIAAGATFCAQKVGAKAIITLTESGTTPFQVSRHAPNLPIYALTRAVGVQRKMAIYRGVYPLLLESVKESHDATIQDIEAMLKFRELLHSGDLYVITSGMQLGVQGATNTLQICRVK